MFVNENVRKSSSTEYSYLYTVYDVQYVHGYVVPPQLGPKLSSENRYQDKQKCLRENIKDPYGNTI